MKYFFDSGTGCFDTLDGNIVTGAAPIKKQRIMVDGEAQRHNAAEPECQLNKGEAQRHTNDAGGQEPDEPVVAPPISGASEAPVAIGPGEIVGDFDGSAYGPEYLVLSRGERVTLLRVFEQDKD